MYTRFSERTTSLSAGELLRERALRVELEYCRDAARRPAGGDESAVSSDVCLAMDFRGTAEGGGGEKEFDVARLASPPFGEYSLEVRRSPFLGCFSGTTLGDLPEGKSAWRDFGSATPERVSRALNRAERIRNEGEH